MLLFKSKCVFFIILVLLVQCNPGFAIDNKGGSVMLAGSWAPEVDIDGWWMSEKLDGVRGCWTGKEMLSRSGKKITTPVWFTKNLPPFALDGELWTGRGEFSDLISIVRKVKPGPGWSKVKYYIFDVPNSRKTFEDRLKTAEEWFMNNPTIYVKILEQKTCRDIIHLMAELKAIEKLNGEGIMLRRPGSMYKNGRSRDILKVKTFHDAEAVVVAHIKGKGRNSKRMGSLRVVLPDGKQFLIGSGFTDYERENPPPVGSLITFKYKEINKSGIPRFASFLRKREKL